MTWQLPTRPRLDFDDAVERLNDGRHIGELDVLKRCLNRVVWVSEWHIPGCLSESFSICTTKASAVAAALSFAGDYPPRGMATALRRSGTFQHQTQLFGDVITTIEKRRLSELLS